MTRGKALVERWLRQRKLKESFTQYISDAEVAAEILRLRNPESPLTPHGEHLLGLYETIALSRSRIPSPADYAELARRIDSFAKRVKIGAA